MLSLTFFSQCLTSRLQFFINCTPESFPVYRYIYYTSWWSCKASNPATTEHSPSLAKAPREGRGHEVLTAGNVDEVLSGCLVHFDVSVADVVLVSFECHVAVLGGDKANQCFAVPTSLWAETQCHTTSAEETRTRISYKIK